MEQALALFTTDELLRYRATLNEISERLEHKAVRLAGEDILRKDVQSRLKAVNREIGKRMVQTSFL